MGYTNSPLVSYTLLSPNHSGQRTHAIDIITPHCVVGQASVQSLGQVFLPTARHASSNYGVGYDGKIGMYVEEKNRSWCSSSSANDNRAVTIEVASDNTSPYAFKPAAYQGLIDLCVDICKRNGKKKLLWLVDKDKTLAYTPKADEMLLTVHRWYANKSCPGDWMYSRMGDLAEKVTTILNNGEVVTPPVIDPTPTKELYRVRKAWNDEKSQIGTYNILENAKKEVDKRKGYYVFDSKGNIVYPTNTTTTTPTQELYRVRKSWDNAKSQIGAYKILANAKKEVDKRQGQGYYVFDSNGKVVYPVEAFKPYQVKVTVKNLYIRTGPGTNYSNRGFIAAPNIYTIVEESDGAGAKKWGKLKSGVGWIALDHVTRI